MLMQDVRYALRLMRQRVGFTVIVILTLAIGIGANTAVFSIVNGVLLRPLPFRDPSRLAMIWEDDRVNLKPHYPVAPANFKDWLDETQAFESLTAYVESTADLTGIGEPVRVGAAVVTTRFFDVLGVRPETGQAFSDEHATPGRHRVAVISHRAWATRFASDPGIVGREIRLGGQPYRILGVMPASFAFPDPATELWRPVAMSTDLLQTRAQHFLNVIGRLKPAVTLPQAQADMDAIALRAQKKYPGTNERRGVTLVPLHEQIVGEVRRPLYLLAAAVGMVLLIGCANVANLMLVKASGRRRELAVRAALGADRMRLVRQLFAEGLLNAAAGGIAGVAIAVASTRALSTLAEGYVPRLGDVHVDGGVLVFALAVSVLTGLLFAAAPAVTSSRTDLQDALREGNRTGTAGPGTRRLRALLVVGELAIAAMLVVGASLVIKSFWRLLQVAPGFNADHVLTGDIELPGSGYGDDAKVVGFYDALFRRIQALPEVRAVGGADTVPMSANGSTAWLTIEGRPRPQGEPPEVGYRSASPGYFRTMQIPVVEGRAFTEADAGGLKVAVVNQLLVQRFFGGRSPIGAHIRLGPNPKAPWRTIVGVIGDVHYKSLEADPTPEAYLPMAQDPFSGMTVVVRTADDPLAVVGALRAIVQSIDPSLPLSRVSTMESMVSESMGTRRLTMLMLGAFAALALGLALLGIYGVMGFVVSQRTHEIGVRIALGARPTHIVGMVLGYGLRLAIAGLAAGVAAALVMTRALQSLLFGVEPTDFATFAVVSAGVLAAGALSCYVPARRAARVDPIGAIRVE